MTKLIYTLFQAALINNVVLMSFFGIRPLATKSNTYQSVVQMGLVVTGVMVVASILTWLVHTIILVPFRAEYLQIVFFTLTMIATVYLFDIGVNRRYPDYANVWKTYRPFVYSNGLVLGVIVLNVQNQLGLMESVFSGLGGGLGFMLVMAIMVGIEERLDEAKIPRPFRGLPILFIAAGLLSLGFTVFSSF